MPSVCGQAHIISVSGDESRESFSSASFVERRHFTFVFFLFPLDKFMKF